MANGDQSKLHALISEDFEESPVDIMTFISDERYLGKALRFEDGTSRVYTYWEGVLKRIHSSDCSEVIFTGPIGSGKSTIAQISLAYTLHETLCLKDPYEYYRMVRAQPISILFFALVKELTEVGVYRGFQELLQSSEWFRNRGVLRGTRDKELTFPVKSLEFTLGSPNVRGYGIVGKHILAGVLDEISEVGSAKERESGESLELTKFKALKIYQQVARRIESRFLQSGPIPGKLFLCSSAEDENAFLERYIEKVKDEPTVLVFSDPLWMVKPQKIYSGRKFPVAVGDKFRPSKVLAPSEKADDYEKRGYRIMLVPIEYYRAFSFDVDGALRDIGGITTAGTRRSRLVPRTDFVMGCIDKSRSHPFTQETVYLGLDDEEGLEDYFKPQERPTGHSHFVHVDIGLTGDALGIAMVHSIGMKKVERMKEDGTAFVTEDDEFSVDFMLRVSNIEGSEVPLWKIRRFVLWLRSELRYPIVFVTFDGYQSSDSKQLLLRSGINSDILSVDKTDEAYVALRSAIYESRIKYYNYPPFISELSELEHDRKRKKVDHPFGGSKDVSDAVAGALLCAIKQSPREVTTTKMVDVLRELQVGGVTEKMARSQWWLKGV